MSRTGLPTDLSQFIKLRQEEPYQELRLVRAVTLVFPPQMYIFRKFHVFPMFLEGWILEAVSTRTKFSPSIE